MKTCTKCLQNKNETEFGKKKNGKNGLRSYCKHCAIIDANLYKLKYPEKVKQNTKRWQQNNQEHMKKYKQQWLQDNPEYSKLKAQDFKRKNPTYANNYIYKRKNIDPVFKMICNLRSRLSRGIKDQSGIKAFKTIELLGCTGKEANQYLESLFQDGMTWKNYGEWEIDHILPCISFDLTKPDEQKKCFHYTNLQPLWREDNNKKRASF